MVARRQARLMLADRSYFVFLASLPFIFGALSLAVPGHAVLAPADPRGKSPDDVLELLVVLNIGAVFMGTALTIRDLVAERRVFRRERSMGLSASAYLTAKVIVFSLVAVLQTATLTTIAVLGKGAPPRGTGLPRDPVVELFLTLLTTAIVSAVIGLALSARAKHQREVVPMFMLAILISLVFCGGMFPLTDRFGANQISWLVPSRWGFAASASTVDLRRIDPLANHDELWAHLPSRWAFSMGMLAISGAVCTGLLAWRPRTLGRTLRGRQDNVPGIGRAGAERGKLDRPPQPGQTSERPSAVEAKTS